MYRSSFLKDITLNSNNFDIIPEIVYKSSKINSSKKINEVPYTFDIRVHGETKRKLKTYVDFLTTLLKLRFS